MRISERHYPILKYLKWNKPLVLHPDAQKKRDLDAFRLDREEENDEQINAEVMNTIKPVFEYWPFCATAFTKQIDVVSDTFLQAAFQNRDKVFTELTIADFCKDEDKPISGTLIWKKIVFNYYYAGDPTQDGFYVVFAHYENRLIYAGNGDKGEDHDWVTKVNRTVVGIKPLDLFFKLAPLIILLFKRYADIEIIEAKKDKKVMLPDGETLLSESDLKINYLDCSWFRTIIRTEGFMVRGHFRLQPYKNSKKEWDRKLVYIEPFQKHGYTRTAKKLINNKEKPSV